MNYRQRRKTVIQEYLKDFHPDLSKSTYPEFVLEIDRLYREGYTTIEIGDMLGKTRLIIQKVLRRYKYPRLQNIVPRVREEQPMWKGCRHVDKQGHIYVKAPKGHPYATKHHGWIFEHRLVMEQYLGRYLLPNEVVHHRDNNPANNHIDNLELFQSNGEHLAKTLRGKCPKWSDSGLEKLRLLWTARRKH